MWTQKVFQLRAPMFLWCRAGYGTGGQARLLETDMLQYSKWMFFWKELSMWTKEVFQLKARMFLWPGPSDVGQAMEPVGRETDMLRSSKWMFLWKELSMWTQEVYQLRAPMFLWRKPGYGIGGWPCSIETDMLRSSKRMFFLQKTLHVDPEGLSVKSPYVFVMQGGLWNRWAGPVARNWHAAIFKVDVFIGKNYPCGPRRFFS